MYRVSTVVNDKLIPSYANEAQALKAIERQYGKPEDCELRFTVQLVYNAAGRVVPILCNMDKDDFAILIHSKFLKVN